MPPIEVRVADGCWRRADPEMLRAALLNLLMNACQAARRYTVDDRRAPTDGAAGSPSAIAVPAFRPKIRERVFEPFFTTRAGGTGLGLAIVRRLIELQDGHRRAARSPGRRHDRRGHDPARPGVDSAHASARTEPDAPCSRGRHAADACDDLEIVAGSGAAAFGGGSASTSAATGTAADR